MPREFPADNWSLLETWGGQTVRLERCSLTVLNASDQLTAYHQEVAFVRARPAPDADTAVDSAPAATPLATIELTDCIARGEAVFLSVEDLQPVYLLWDNGLLATTDRLLTRRRRTGGAEARRDGAAGAAPPDGGRPRRALPPEQLVGQPVSTDGAVRLHATTSS